MRLSWVILTLLPAFAVAFEPFSTTYLAGVAISALGGYLYYNRETCETKECCDHPWVIRYPSVDLSKLYGQPLVGKIVRDVIRRRTLYSRPLLLSFHGPVGTGKTFLSTLLSEMIFLRGKESGYVHFYTVGFHFPNPSSVGTYQENLRSSIEASLMICPYSVFIFDEADKMPPKLLESLAIFMDPRGRIDLLDTSKAVFILLSNTGSKAIVKKSYELYRNGVDRKDFKIIDFENDLSQAVFNEDGAFKNSALIKRELIDAYVPFLPLEKEHVKDCIIQEYRRFHYKTPSETSVQEILKGITFSKEMSDLFAETGCKRVSALVARYDDGQE